MLSSRHALTDVSEQLGVSPLTGQERVTTKVRDYSVH